MDRTARSCCEVVMRVAPRRRPCRQRGARARIHHKMRGFLSCRRCPSPARERKFIALTTVPRSRTSDFVGAKCIAQPDELASFESNHVETAYGRLLQTAAAGGQVVLRRTHDAPFLLPADARHRAAIPALRTCANFDEDQRAVAIAHHEIDLAAWARHIARDEPQTLALQKLSRTRLESVTDELGPAGPRKVVPAGGHA
ncbi:hypothetical protein BN2475_40030 [Paraburkholderia ribeironis]|uniref:Uncharacterized protein n=1 Tax=Paraburkholderia ribeironis TaxID=1247936 RepID=A0A1N7RJ93_9BURK|nr:hypothetical protein BN2475_40030 [Paraburkholderia ribeironis]